MNCTAAEKDLKKRFEGIYERGQLPVIKDIERRVFLRKTLVDRFGAFGESHFELA